MDRQAAHDLTRACHAAELRINAVWSTLPLRGEDAAERIRDILGAPPDLIHREMAGGGRVLYIASIADLDRIEKALLAGGAPHPGSLRRIATFGAAIQALLGGEALLLPAGLAVRMDRWPQRAPTEPPDETVTRGPHIGFVEQLETNLGMLRYRIQDPSLRYERIETGERGGTHGALLYIDGLIRDDLLAEVRRHLASAHPSFTEDASTLAEWMTPRSGSLFPTTGATERPDRAAAALLEGRAAVMVEGSPVAIIAPTTFWYHLQTPGDYYRRATHATTLRLLRLVGAMVALLLTPLYVALVAVNTELVPTPMFISVIQTRHGVPLPVLPEVLLLEVIVDIIREAGMQVPGSIGQAVSVVGSVVIGQSAVMAGLVSAPTVVIVSMAFVASFVVASPVLASTVRILRFPLIAIGFVFGVFGVAWGVLLLLIYLCALESFGVPYLAPITPTRGRGLQDAIRRLPLPAVRRSYIAHMRRPLAPGRG